MISALDSTLSSLGVPSGNEAERTELGQEEFLRLMTTQLKNQDPFKPMESGEFLGQLAQFGTVAGLADLQRSFSRLAGSLVSSQALQGASLVGRSVLVESGRAQLTSGSVVEGAVDLPAGSSTVRLRVENASGEIVRQLELGAHAGGLVKFAWSGDTDAGEPATPGTYRVTADYFNGQDMQSARVLIQANVDSVSASANGLTVNVAGVGAVPFALIREIG